MEWILFFLYKNNLIRYTTNVSNPKKFASSQTKFLQYLQEICPIIIRYNELLTEITSFSIIFLDLTAKNWRVVPYEDLYTNVDLPIENLKFKSDTTKQDNIYNTFLNPVHKEKQDMFGEFFSNLSKGLGLKKISQNTKTVNQPDNQQKIVNPFFNNYTSRPKN
jgi:hypothetical protein